MHLTGLQDNLKDNIFGEHVFYIDIRQASCLKQLFSLPVFSLLPAIDLKVFTFTDGS